METDELEIEITKLIYNIYHKYMNYPTLDLECFLSKQFDDIIKIGGGLRNE